jgi:heat-inducible transcriptional repressor
MPSEVRISPRERVILTAVIELYIATGEPVASQAIAQHLGNKDGMGPATIRNVMASLSESGLLEQPHTSAGRIPTAAAFRFHVEQLNGGPRLTPQALAPQVREKIEERFAGVNSRAEFLERTSHVLALISSGVGVALTAVNEMQSLEHIHFSRVAPGRVLAVMVTKGGAVLDKVLRLDRDLEHSELQAASRYLNENFHGWSIERVRRELSRRVEQERSEYDRILRSVQELYRNGALDGLTSSQLVFVEGVANLLAIEIDQGRLRQLLQALEAKQRLIELLNAYVDASQHAVRVVVGLEEAMPGMSDLVLIGAPAWLGIESLGTVAVIGPTRIQYQETINAVSFIAQLSERILERPQ